MNKKTSKTTSSKKLKPSTTNNGQYRDEKDNDRRKQMVTHDRSSKNVILLDPNSSFSPTEKVFSIDHIVESIFSKLNVPTLRNCRLVSRRWAHLGAKALQNIVTISLYRSRFDDQRYLFSSRNEENAIPVLCDLMNNSSEFPCKSFSFRNRGYTNMEIDTSVLKPFCKSQACYVEKISFEGPFFIEDLKQLIFTLGLNVKQLDLGNVFYESKRNTDSKSASSQTLTRPAFRNLRVFKSWNYIPEDIVHQILESSPNLSEVSLHHQNLHCLVKPKNLLHLVTKLRMYFTNEAIDCLEVVANNHGNNFAVQEFEFGGHSEHFRDPEPPRRLLEFLDKILRGCSATCTKMVLLNTLQDFQFPRMPQVNHLSFTYLENYSTRRPQKMFFQSGSLQSTFPSLESLKIDRYGYDDDDPHPPIENIFGGHHCPPLPNVKKLTLLIPNADDNVLQSFRQMFPNAVIHTEEN